MNERRIVLRQIRPEQTVFKLESDGTRRNTVTLSQEELARINVRHNVASQIRLDATSAFPAPPTNEPPPQGFQPQHRYPAV
jgi:hypothetical protein